MSEEEAIAILKRVNQANRFDGLYSSVEIIFEAQKTLLNLIDKLQKENEELKGDLKRDIYARDCLAKHSISKDKIREKIKQLEISPFVLYGQTIEVLKELLEEN